LTAIVLSSPFDIALAVALACLPLLLGIWLLLFGRTFAEARRAREAQIRLALAAELGLRPREMTSMSTQALFKLREQAAFDDLTGAMRRGAGIAAIEREIARARRHKSPLCVAFVDIDGLKPANERHGHAAGDKMLRRLAQALKEGLRGQDLVLRYGGDEFVCVLPDTRAEAGRAKLSWIHTEAGKAGIRFSVGLAELERSDDVVSFLARADRELYELKARRGEIVQLPQGKEGRRRGAEPPTDTVPIDRRG
jgi:diguanylate cyclase (GGDEF)-like protein